MQMKCEKAVSDIFPVARSLIAKKLVDSYDFSQTKAARLMNISQPAVSQYKKNIRGAKTGDISESPGFMDIVNDIAKGLADGSIKPDHLSDEMCRLCKLFRE